MAGLAVLLPQMNELYNAQLGSVDAPDATGSAARFAEKLRQDSAEAGTARTLLEKRRLAERLHAAGDFEAALDAFHAAAEAAQELDEPGQEAIAVLGMADCLSRETEVDDVLVLGMFAHSAARAAAAGDDATRFHALAGAATLKRALGRKRESAAAWDAVLEFARGLGSSKFTSMACTQLAFVLLDSDDGAGVEMVNKEKETVHRVASEEGAASSSADPAGSVQVQLGPGSDLRRAIKLLEEAQGATAEAGNDPAQAATACMNLAGALRRAGNTANKRRAERELASAFAAVRQAGPDQLRLQVARHMVELHEESAWLSEDRGDEHASMLSECRAVVQAADSHIVKKQTALEIAQEQDPETRFMQERSAWAQRKLVEMSRQDSDSEDEAAGPAHPKGEDWRRP